MTLAHPGKSSRRQSFGVSCEVENQEETLYTCPSNVRAEVEMLYVVNADGNTTINGVWFDSSESESFSIIGGKNLVSGEYILLTGAVLVLEAGDALKFTPSANATPNMDVMCTVVETFKPVG